MKSLQDVMSDCDDLITYHNIRMQVKKKQCLIIMFVLAWFINKSEIATLYLYYV